MDCFWIHKSETELPELRRVSEGVAVLPLASIESHGPHLPVGSDILCARELLDRVAEQETVAILPVLTYSYVAEARMLPGAIHTRSDLLMEQVEGICDEVHRNGFEKVVLLHCHGGNVALHQMFCKRILEREKPYAVYSIPVFGNLEVDMSEFMETEHRGHACEMETSMNMVAAPEFVRLDHLGERTFPPEEGGDLGDVLTPVDWTALHPEMAVGLPQKATPEKGERVFAAWAEAVVSTLRKIKADQVTPTAMKDYTRRCHGQGK